MGYSANLNNYHQPQPFVSDWIDSHCTKLATTLEHQSYRVCAAISCDEHAQKPL